MSPSPRDTDVGQPADPVPGDPDPLPTWLPDAIIEPLTRHRPVLLGHSPYLLLAIGLGLGLLGLAQLLIDSEPLPTAAFEVAVPFVGSAALLYAGWWTTTVDRGPQKHASAVLVSLVFMAIATGMVGFILLTQLPLAPSSFDWPFAVSTALSIGALVGTPTGFVLDEVVARQEALEAEYRETKRLTQRLQVVNRVIRHNIRNELTVALGGIEIARSHVTSPEASAWAERSTAALERLHTHAEKVLQIDSLEQSTAVRTTVDVVGYVSGYLQAQQFDSEGVRIQTDLPDRAEVSAHPLIGTAIIEVIENAVVHNTGDDLAVRVQVEAAADVVDVVVADTGRGIPSIEIESLDRGEADSLQHGEGVGLWLTKWITEASGGELSIEPNEPSGTVVRLRLPAAG